MSQTAARLPFSGKDMQRDTSEWKRTLWYIAEQEGIWRISSPFSDQRWLSGRLERSIVWFWLRWIEWDCGLLGKHFHLSLSAMGPPMFFTPLSVTPLPLSHRDTAQADGRWLTRPVERGPVPLGSFKGFCRLSNGTLKERKVQAVIVWCPPQRKGWVKAIRGFSLMCLFIAQMKLWGYFVCVSCDFPQLRGQNEHARHREPAWSILFHHLETGAPLPPLCPCLFTFPDVSLLLIEELLMAEDSSAEHVCRLLWFVTDPHIMSQN